MDKFVVVVFDSESKAYEGARALQNLHYEGSIDLYAKAVVAREVNGTVAIKQEGDSGPIGTTVGLLTGSLIGLIGGPVGVAIGAGVGMYGGVIYDLSKLGIGEDFLYEVGTYLLPGKAAVVADLWEEWTTPVDTLMEQLGGVVVRRTRGELLDAQMESDALVLDAELTELEAELSALEAESEREDAEAKARLQAKIDASKAKMQAMRDSIQTRMETSKQETEAKVKSLQDQAAKARGARKAKLEAGVADLRSKQERRNELLGQAWKLTKQALKG